MAANTFTNIAPSTTDNVVILGISGYIIRIFGLAIDCGSTATNVVFNSKGIGTGTAISMRFSLGAYGNNVLPQPQNLSTRTIWFQTYPGESLTASTGAGSTVGIQIVYDLYAPLQTAFIRITPFSIYAPTNITTTITFDADNTSLDELASVLGSLINLFKTGTTITTSFTATNVTTNRSLDATDTSLDVLADVLGTLIQSLTPLGTSADTYTTMHVSTTTSFDAQNTSLNEVASVLGTVIATLQGMGSIQ